MIEKHTLWLFINFLSYLVPPIFTIIYIYSVQTIDQIFLVNIMAFLIIIHIFISAKVGYVVRKILDKPINVTIIPSPYHI